MFVFEFLKFIIYRNLLYNFYILWNLLIHYKTRVYIQTLRKIFFPIYVTQNSRKLRETKGNHNDECVWVGELEKKQSVCVGAWVICLRSN